MGSRALLMQMSDVDIRLLRVFRAVVEAGGVSAAELELNIGRSAISRHLKDLEIRLNIVLCRRGRGGFSLTDDGRHVYQSTLRLLAAIDTFRTEVNDVHRDLTGNLAIALFDKMVSNPQSRISAAIGRFDELAPAVTLDVSVSTINEIEKGVMDGRYGMGIIPTHRSSTSLVYLPLFSETMNLYAGRSHPAFDTPPGAATDKLIRHAKFAGLGYHSPNMEITNLKGYTRDASCYDQEAVATLILSGKYLGFLPDHYARRFEEQQLMRALDPAEHAYSCEFAGIYRQSPKPTRILQTFIDCLTEAHQAPGGRD
ncbi:LysR family transcriptional regulator [Granulosicoccaceae sp. 1_MG-2023]|nr:LysR family transcriptional regulator [Granulosicoccaceae sp. 1_MG-2023]